MSTITISTMSKVLHHMASSRTTATMAVLGVVVTTLKKIPKPLAISP